jgi:serine protease Do
MQRITRNGSIVLAAAVLLTAGYAIAARPTAPSDLHPTDWTPDPGPSTAAPRLSLPDFTAIVRQYGPAVVNVSTTGTANVQAPFGQVDPDDPFWQFFRHFGVPQDHPAVPTQGLGSGFIVKSDGVILTNAHVVDGATRISVKLTDRREFTAKVIGEDKDTDVAVLRIDAKGLPTVKLGDPARTQVGEWVLAIGSPFGFENSVTAGIVSARARTLPNENYVPFLQTDVPVNPGNSGGPLFNLAGEVIGINSQIYSRSGGYMGLSFAIPIDVAMRVEGQLVSHGRVRRARMGVTVQGVDQALADSFGLPKPEGALVSSVEPGSAAEKAGLEAGDVILSMDGKPIDSSAELPPRVAELSPGTRAQLTVWRGGKERDVSVVLGEAEGGRVATAEEPGHGEGRLGLAVRPPTPEERQEEHLHGGLVVEEATGPAASAGIQPGDVVLAVSGTPVKSAEQMRALVSKAGTHLALLVQRGDARIFVPVTLG